MTCLTEERLQQWIDQELDATASASARQHLESCGECRRRCDDLKAVIRGSEALPREIEPTHDLWPGIEARIARTSGAFHRLPPWWQLAAAAAVLAVGVWIGSQWFQGPQVPTETDQAYLALSSEVDKLRNQLEVLVTQRGDQFDAATVVAVKETLTTLDSANEEFARALEQDPANRRLQSMRASSTKKEAHVLADLVVALNGASMAGIDPTT